MTEPAKFKSVSALVFLVVGLSFLGSSVIGALLYGFNRSGIILIVMGIPALLLSFLGARSTAIRERHTDTTRYTVVRAYDSGRQPKPVAKRLTLAEAEARCRDATGDGWHYEYFACTPASPLRDLGNLIADLDPDSEDTSPYRYAPLITVIVIALGWALFVYIFFIER